MRIFEKIKEMKQKRYWEKRATLWQNFKYYNNINKLECGLVEETENYHPRLWEYDCLKSCCDKDFFEKYGCMYIKGFMNY